MNKFILPCRANKDEIKYRELKTTILKLATVYWCSYKPTQNTLRKHGTWKNREQESGAIILDREIYIYSQEILKTINDIAKLKKLKENPTLTREGQLESF